MSVVGSDTSPLHYLILCGAEGVLPRFFQDMKAVSGNPMPAPKGVTEQGVVAHWSGYSPCVRPTPRRATPRES